MPADSSRELIIPSFSGHHFSPTFDFGSPMTSPFLSKVTSSQNCHGMIFSFGKKKKAFRFVWMVNLLGVMAGFRPTEI